MGKYSEFIHSFESNSLSKMPADKAVLALLRANPKGLTLGVILNRMRQRRNAAKNAVDSLITAGMVDAKQVNQNGKGRSSLLIFLPPQAALGGATQEDE